MPKPTEFSYEGKDLETMSLAAKYHHWILALFRPYLGKRLVEVGAGSGSFSRMLAALEADLLCLVEPSKEMYPLLVKETKHLQKQLKLLTHNNFLVHAAKDIKKHRPDSIFYVNVLEHVPDDVAELKAMYDLLAPGGRIFIFVPALNALMSDFDKKIGHFRRYSKRELEQKTRDAGFSVLHSRYFDFFGIVPWWLTFRILRSMAIKPHMTRLYDRLVVPIARRLESLITPPVGKNVLLVAEKPPE